ncbi:MAG: restriction endonuclease subunit S [Acidobacteriia bacterium]|nr:restriction endonuclease subunit S [Terriglobia bacterium]
MRNSEAERLGTVPSHWRVVRLSVVSDVINGFPFDSQYFVQEGGTPLIRIRDLHSAQTEVSFSGPIIEEALVRTGEIIVGMDGDFNVARWRGPTALLNQRMCCLRPKPLAHAGFIRYAVAQPLTVIGHLSHSTTVKHLSSRQVKRIQLAVPPLPEQTAIGRFLDHADCRIQRYILAKERLIELLEEERQAIIHQAVTGRIDVRTGQPYPAYKDSGVEWLGDVPEHWEVRRLKTFSEMQSGDAITAMSIEETGEYPVFGGNGIRGYGPRHTHDGDFVLIGRQGALCGNIHIARGRFWASEHAVVAMLRRGDVFEWFSALLEVMNLNQYSIAAAQPGLSVDRVLNLWAPVPPVEEQSIIAERLGVVTGERRAAATAAKRQIDLLREYRARLIADVVTGRLDVREVAASLRGVDPLESGDTPCESDVNTTSDLGAPDPAVETAYP